MLKDVRQDKSAHTTAVPQVEGVPIWGGQIEMGQFVEKFGFPHLQVPHGTTPNTGIAAITHPREERKIPVTITPTLVLPPHLEDFGVLDLVLNDHTHVHKHIVFRLGLNLNTEFLK